MIETIFPQAASQRAALLTAPAAPRPAPDSGNRQGLAEPPSAILADAGVMSAAEQQAHTAEAFSEVAESNGFPESPFVEAQQDFVPVYQTANQEFYFQEASDPIPLTNEFIASSPFSEPDEVILSPDFEFPEEHMLNGHSETLSGGEPAPLIAQPDHDAQQEIAPSENGFYAASPLNRERFPEADHPVSDFPYLVETEKRRKLNAKTLLALAGAALLVCLAAAYLFIYKPFFGASEDSPTSKAGANLTNEKSSANPATANKESSAPKESAKPTEGKDKPADGKKPEEAKQAEAAPSIEANNAESARFALQAGVFSTEANANNLAEQLKRAGIPAYVASAKTNKFRVLVGRFATANDAQKYIPQAQTRAQTAGIKLDLLASEINP